MKNNHPEKVKEDQPSQATSHHGSTTQAGSDYGQGSNDLPDQGQNQGSESNDGSNYGNEEGWKNEALRKEDMQDTPPREGKWVPGHSMQRL
ncbi:MAG TPA: hypothetical protein VN616_04905 [Puia sp.]|nr:hypothetical protein [Puia sp.]